MNIPEVCDVVVIGGGPTGTTAATSLSQKGYHVVLLEKKQHPRNVVGESLIPHFWKYTDIIGVTDKIKSEGFIEKNGGTVLWKGDMRQMRFADFGYERPALHVERDSFDSILLEHTKEQENTQVFEKVTVHDVEFFENSVDVHYRGDADQGVVKAKYVIDATGQRALISRKMKTRVIDEDFRFVSMWGYFDNSKYVTLGGRVHPFSDVGEIAPTTFVSSIGEWGWSWHIPQRKRTSVGLVIPIEEYKEQSKKHASPEAYFLALCHELPTLKDLLASAEYVGDFDMIRDYSYQPVNLCGPNYFLAGDAAAFVDPVFSLGVTISMFSGLFSAWAVDMSLKKPEKSKHYQDIYVKQYRGRLAVARALAVPSHDCDQSELAMRMIHFERPNELELMYVASRLSNRSEHIEKMLGKRIVSSDKVYELGQLDFG